MIGSFKLLKKGSVRSTPPFSQLLRLVKLGKLLRILKLFKIFDALANEMRFNPASFRLVEGVSLYGGFRGDELSLSARDALAHATVLSGEVGDANTTADNVYHVVTGGAAPPAESMNALPPIARAASILFFVERVLAERDGALFVDGDEREQPRERESFTRS